MFQYLVAFLAGMYIGKGGKKKSVSVDAEPMRESKVDAASEDLEDLDEITGDDGETDDYKEVEVIEIESPITSIKPLIEADSQTPRSGLLGITSI